MRQAPPPLAFRTARLPLVEMESRTDT